MRLDPGIPGPAIPVLKSPFGLKGFFKKRLPDGSEPLGRHARIVWLFSFRKRHDVAPQPRRASENYE